VRVRARHDMTHRVRVSVTPLRALNLPYIHAVRRARKMGAAKDGGGERWRRRKMEEAKDGGGERWRRRRMEEATGAHGRGGG
jgi:hypothetical protein